MEVVQTPGGQTTDLNGSTVKRCARAEVSTSVQVTLQKPGVNIGHTIDLIVSVVEVDRQEPGEKRGKPLTLPAALSINAVHVLRSAQLWRLHCRTG